MTKAKSKFSLKKAACIAVAVIVCLVTVAITTKEARADTVYANPLYQVSDISYGSTGNSVYFAQELLAGLGYYNGYIDGDAGNMTESAIRAFQSDWGLVVDGYCGYITWGDLIYAATMYSSVDVVYRGRYYGVCYFETKEMNRRCFIYSTSGHPTAIYYYF